MPVTMRFKLVFFDTAQVTRAMDRATAKALARAGAFVRTRAKSSIRRRKKSSAPGRPPSSHTGHLKRLIYFAYDRAAQDVVIGPIPFKAGEAPSLLEFGGVVRRRAEPGRRARVLRYRRRPFMGPALEAETPKLPARWRNSIRGG